MQDDFLDRKIPALLDRLVSYHEGVGGRLRKVPPAPPASTRDVCSLVLTDLRTLLTTPALSPNSPVHEFELASRSVINYGVPDHFGRTLDAPIVERVMSAVRRAVEAFEPRIVPGTLRVDLRAARAETGEPVGAGAVSFTPNALAIEVTAQACPLPMPEQILLRTMIQSDGSLGIPPEAHDG